MPAINKQHAQGSFSMGEFVWWMGVVVDRMDPEKLGRLRVRIFGYHSGSEDDIPGGGLPWATVVQPITSSFFGGIGTSPTGIVEGTTVLGFFQDGHNAQVPVVLGTIGGKPPERIPKDGGFKDPNEIYSRHDDGEQDTSRLARGERTNETHVQWQRDNLENSVPEAHGGSWGEPQPPYAAQYPYNHVRETEPRPGSDMSGMGPIQNYGHVQELDDTPGAERIFQQHKSGTFTEIHPDGEVVIKNVHEKFEITWRDDHLYVKGNATVTIDGNSKVKIGGNADIEISGNCKETIGGNYNLDVGGYMEVNVGGHHYETSGPHHKITSGRIDLN